jgi:hypothetical protein
LLIGVSYTTTNLEKLLKIDFEKNFRHEKY